MTKCYLFLFLTLVLSGCSGGAVVFAPTPLPPDFSPAPYIAPGGVFTLVLPRNWSVYEQVTLNLVSASFAPPGSESALVQVAVINTGQALDAALLTNLVNQYQTQIRPDLERYTEQDRQLMSDGSWRVTGIRLLPGGQNQQVNTFIQSNGMLLALLEVIMPPAADAQAQLQTLINTFTLADRADLTPVSLTALAGVATTSLEVVHISTWSSPAGVFFVTGEVVNHTPLPLAGVPIQVMLTTVENVGVAEATDIVMGHAVPPGGFAPFSLRFGQGQPPDATGYVLTLGRSDWRPNIQTVVSSDGLTWDSATQFSQDGSLFITGTVTNTGADPVQQLKAVATVFDASGRVIAAGYTDMGPPVLAPDETTGFTILIPETGGTPANYIVTVQALACDARC